MQRSYEIGRLKGSNRTFLMHHNHFPFTKGLKYQKGWTSAKADQYYTAYFVLST